VYIILFVSFNDTVPARHVMQWRIRMTGEIRLPNCGRQISQLCWNNIKYPQDIWCPEQYMDWNVRWFSSFYVTFSAQIKL